MLALRKLTLRRYVLTNFLMAAVFINVILFAPALRMGESFTAGLATGIGIAWLAFAIFGLIELRRGGRGLDERVRAVFAKASSLAFWVLVLAASLAAALLRSESLGIELSASDLAAYANELGLVVFGVAFFIFERRA